MKALVIGTGSVGAVFGAVLKNAGHDVTTLCRSNYSQVKSEGFNFTTHRPHILRFMPDRVIASLQEVKRSPFDLIVFSVKSIDRFLSTESCLFRQVNAPHTALLSLQNGVCAGDSLCTRFDNTVLSGSCWANFQQVRSGFIEELAAVKEQPFRLGVLKFGQADAGSMLDSIAGSAGCVAKVSDARAESWEKLVFNVAWNLGTALFDKSTRQILETHSELTTVQRLALEVTAIARASGTEMPLDTPRRIIDYARHAAPIIPSTLQDRRKGKPMELGPICGNVIEKGLRLGVPTPTMSRVYQELRRISDAKLSSSYLTVSESHGLVLPSLASARTLRAM